MSKALIVTVGVGEGIEHGICCSIRYHNPEYIIFLVTPESKNKLQLVLNDKVMENKNYECEMLTDSSDIEKVKFETLKIIDKVKRKYALEDISIDYTPGTKAMSAGVVLAGVERRVGGLVYISGTRDKNGRVISGTERIISIEPNRTYAELLFQEAVRLFNSCQFDFCQKVISQAKILVSDPEFIKKSQLLEDLAEGYSLWDKFDLEGAFYKIDLISKNELLGMWGIKGRIEQNKEFLYKEKKEKFCLERAIDLLENAGRRGSEFKFDDAVARLYRCLEFIAQLKIAEKDLYSKDKKGGIDTENLNIDKLSDELKQRYCMRRDEKDGKVKLGLYEDYELLFYFGEPLGKLFIEKYKMGELKKLLSLRNNSILAHGFNRISEETYKDMLNLTKDFLRCIFPNLENLIEKIKFPKVNLVHSLFT